MKNILTILIAFPFLINAQDLNNTYATSEYAFVKNEGQFDGRNWRSEKIEYGIKQNRSHIFFSEKGLTYRFDKIIKNPTRDKSNPNSPKRKNISELIYVTWLGSNNDVEIIASKKTTSYHSYAIKDYTSNELRNVNMLFGYQKITYKNLYNNIDVEYIIHPNGGIKYNVILHPGANPSQVKMKYSSAHTSIHNEQIDIRLNDQQQLEITTSLGKITEHEPVTFFKKNKSAVASNYKFENNILSFELANYDNTQEIIIDPWIISPTFSGTSAVWEVETDAQGNIYTTGGEMPMQLKKHNSAGVLQWTYNTPFDTVGGDWLGTLTTDIQGNSYITQGTAPELEKIDNTGNMVWHSNGNLLTNAFLEYWSITFNADTTQLVIGGTSGNTSPFETFSAIYNIDINNGNEISSFTFAHNTSPLNTPEEVRTIAVAPNNQYIYLTHDSIGTIDQDFDTHPLTARSFQYNNQHNLDYKAENFFPANQNGAPLKALIVNDNFFYTHTGDSIHQWDLNSGALLNSAMIPGGANTINSFNGKLIIHNAGLDVDSCNNVYAGSTNNVVKFDENLNILGQATVAFIVHDVSVNNNGEVIAIGAGFNNTQSIRNGKIEAISSLNSCPQFFLRTGITTNLNQTEKNNNFSIFPNPFNSSFNINYSLFKHHPTINVYNLIGELIATKTITSYSTLLDLQNQPQGVYFVKISDGANQINQKIIKQ